MWLDDYSELHTLEYDIEHSDCGSCQHANNCQYYCGKCPQGYTGGKTIVTNAFSGNMINTEEYSTIVSKISEEEFKELIPHADSNISHPGISTRYNLPLNPSKIKLVPGDEVLVVYIHGGKLPTNGEVPWNVNLSFEHIRVIPKVII